MATSIPKPHGPTPIPVLSTVQQGVVPASLSWALPGPGGLQFPLSPQCSAGPAPLRARGAAPALGTEVLTLGRAAAGLAPALAAHCH